MPDDTTPHGGEAMHTPPDRAQIPQPKPGARSLEENLTVEQPAPGVNGRPAIPPSAEPMAADVEDEDSDPVKESGPGVAEDTGKTSVTRQPGG